MTETMDDDVTLTAVEEDDTTEMELRSWGVSGQPVTWAWTHWQPVVSAIRAVNTGFAELDMVQSALDTVFPDKGYEASAVCLPHPPTAEFTIQPGEIDPEVDPTEYLDVIHVDLVGDEDLGLADEQVTWDFGDGTTAHDLFGWDHGYTEPGEYKVRCTIPVAGVVYETSQDYTVGDPEPASVDPAYAARDATVFDDPENPPEELPYGNAPPTEEPAAEEGAFDPGEHTVQEVKDYLAEHPDELDAVLAAEEAGKARTTILDL